MNTTIKGKRQFYWISLLSVVTIVLSACSGGTTPAVQGITKIVIDSAKSEKVTFAGTPFGAGG